MRRCRLLQGRRRPCLSEQLTVPDAGPGTGRNLRRGTGPTGESGQTRPVGVLLQRLLMHWVPEVQLEPVHTLPGSAQNPPEQFPLAQSVLVVQVNPMMVLPPPLAAAGGANAVWMSGTVQAAPATTPARLSSCRRLKPCSGGVSPGVGRAGRAARRAHPSSQSLMVRTLPQRG